MTAVLGYHHLSLSVTDLGKSTEWYQQVLGLDVAAEIEGLKDRFAQLGVDHSEVKSGSGGTAMITLRDPDNIQIEVFGGELDPSIAGGRTTA